MEQNTTKRQPQADAEKTEETTAKHPVQVIREGAIAASIWRRETDKGGFYEFTLSRSWKSEATGKSGYSQSFTGRYAEQLLKVVERAKDWIQEHESTANPAGQSA